MNLARGLLVGLGATVMLLVARRRRTAPSRITDGAVRRVPEGTHAPDDAFYRQALTRSLAAVGLCRHAEVHAHSGPVRALATRLADGHMALVARLRSTTGLEVAPMPPRLARLCDEIDEAPPGDYDRTWLRCMADAHETAIGLYLGASRMAIDPATRELARQAMPELDRCSCAIDAGLLATIPQPDGPAGRTPIEAIPPVWRTTAAARP